MEINLQTSQTQIRPKKDQSNSNKNQKIKKNQISPMNADGGVNKNSLRDQDEGDQKKEKEIKQIGFFELFRFGTKFDIILMIIGAICAAGVGTAMPAFAFIWGRMTDSFLDNDSMVESSRETMITFIYIGIGAFGGGWGMFACWMIAGERQGIACRKAYLRSLLKQQIGWFDVVNQTQLSSKFATDCFAFQGAIGEKISTLIMALSMLIAGFIFAFITGWLMTLVVLATIPALLIAGIAYMNVITNKDQFEEKSYSKAGGRAEQAISAIKTVKQLNGQEFESKQYQQYLQEASSSSYKYALYSGLGIGGIFFVMLASYSLGFWYGSKCVAGTENCPSDISGQSYSAGDVLVIFFCVLMGGFNLSQFTPALKKISEGRQAGKRVFEVIDRQSLIKNPQNGIRIDNLKGVICFQNVTFAYPKDPSNKIFQNLNLEFSEDRTGLVGQSGCGKSTILQLVMRFYDPQEGRVTLDGHDLKTLDLQWLRKQFGYVGQEPVLFATSIKENLLFGNQNSTDEDIEQALKMAEAYTFTQELQEKLETYVGFGGGQLSGGQKQRIAIARAILRKPKILLLDEATSALDRRNQKLIQQTLRKITEGRKTITVAHRIKTIMQSNIICVFEKGGVKEKGPFTQLKWARQHQHQLQEADNQANQEEQNIIKKEHKNPEDEGQIIKNEQFKSKEQLQKEQQEKLLKKYEDDIFTRIFAYSKGKKLLFTLGIMMALANGVVFPIFSLFLARMLSSLLIITISPDNLDQLQKINLYALLFLLFGIASFILSTGQIGLMTVVGEHITKNIRVDTFKKILKMPVPWFDIPKNNAGALVAKLSADCQIVNGVTTSIVSITIQNISSLLSGIIIALVFQWRTALVALALLPFMILSGIVEMKLNTGFSDKTDTVYKDSSVLIIQSMTNIRTVTSFGSDGSIINKYDKKMQQPLSLVIKKGNISGLLYGFSQFMMFIIFGLLFFIGSIFVRDNEGVSVEDMFTAVYGIMFAGMTAGNNAHFMPDVAACNSAAARIFQIQDSQDEQQMQVEEESKMLKDGISGDIVLSNVDFKYASRKQYVFKNINLKIKNGNKVAFVGTSGCGKSTILQLLQRFYFPEKGDITINGINIKDFDLHYLRSSFGTVSQEPVLFNGSFKYNIQYNIPGEIDDEIRKAAQSANALSFIIGNENMLEVGEENQSKNGFDRSVGVRGSHISGGQKQRVAIARSILRKPKKLLLDEATSALDRDNEIKVQESLDLIMQNKTCLTVAHRIATIKNSDQIFVFEKGKIIQQGNYEQLISARGYFYNLERGIQFT